jgi:hypothetical protein
MTSLVQLGSLLLHFIQIREKMVKRIPFGQAIMKEEASNSLKEKEMDKN